MITLTSPRINILISFLVKRNFDIHEILAPMMLIPLPVAAYISKDSREMKLREQGLRGSRFSEIQATAKLDVGRAFGGG